MQFQVITLEEARLELLTVFNYYEDKRNGLGDNFLDEVERKYNVLSENPYTFGFVDNKDLLRAVKVSHFPYLIIYEIKELTVMVLKIHNTYRQLK